MEPRAIQREASLPRVKGLESSAIRTLFQDRRLRLKYEEGGVIAFIYLLGSRDSLKLHDCEVSVKALLQRGFEPDFSVQVISADPNEHSIGLVSCVTSLLLRANGLTHAWKPDSQGFPRTSVPLEELRRGYLGTVSGLRYPSQNEPADKKTLWAADGPNSMPLFSAPPKGFKQLFHATSWNSTMLIEIGLSPSPNAVNGPSDFGQGFYCTPDLEFAVYWAMRTGNEDRFQGCPAIIVFEISEDYPILCATECLEGEKWVKFVSRCRKTFDDETNAEIVEGKVCRKVQDVNRCLSLPSPGRADQLCFKSRTACSLLRMTEVIFFKSNLQQ